MLIVSQVYIHDIKESSNSLIILKYCYTPNHLHLVVEKVAVAGWTGLYLLDNFDSLSGLFYIYVRMSFNKNYHHTTSPPY